MVGVLFPGQGSQHVGMGEYLIDAFPRANHVFEEASDVLGFDLKDLCINGPEDKLQLTENTQPALLATSFATYRVVKDMDEINVHAAAGHSVGEYAALVAAGVLSFAKAIELVRLRGQLMQKSVPVGQGAMLAIIGLEASEARKLCTWACKETKLTPLEPANYNSPAQTVVSGSAEIIQWVVDNFTPDKISSDKTKVRLIPLKVSAPFHCSMMKPAEREMAAAINDVEFVNPQFGIAQNFSGKIETDAETIKKNLIAQISGPVRWVECMLALKEAGIELLGEIGPGKVLAGLTKKIDNENFSCVSLNSISDLQTFDRQIVSHNEKMKKLKERGSSGYGDL